MCRVFLICIRFLSRTLCRIILGKLFALLSTFFWGGANGATFGGLGLRVYA